MTPVAHPDVFSPGARPPISSHSLPPPRVLTRLSRARLLTAALLGGAMVLASPQAARADATVVVMLKRDDGSTADGTVLLSRGDTKLRCTTAQGRCEIKNVPGGSYTVEVEQGSQPASKPRQVMIPPSGEVKLNVAAK